MFAVKDTTNKLSYTTYLSCGLRWILVSKRPNLKNGHFYVMIRSVYMES